MVSKYNSKKTVVDGQTFDSKKEANRYKELRLLEKAGVIKDLRTQVKFKLIPAQRDEATGKVIERECSYKADAQIVSPFGLTKNTPNRRNPKWTGTKYPLTRW